MIVKRFKLFSEPSKIAILELSSSSVKLLLGPSLKTTSFDKFKFYQDRTDTALGVLGGKMLMDYFKSKVLPSILKFIDIARRENAKIVCVATAAYRNSRNIDEILSVVPVPIKVLSGIEESGMAPYAYMLTTKRNLNNYDWLVSIDAGGSSTDIRVIDIKGGMKESGISLNIGAFSPENVVRYELKRLEKKYSFLKNEPRVLIISVGRRVCAETGYDTPLKLHDLIVPDDKISWHLGIRDIRSIIGLHILIANASGLAYGCYYKYINGKL